MRRGGGGGGGGGFGAVMLKVFSASTALLTARTLSPETITAPNMPVVAIAASIAFQRSGRCIAR
jgi:hypothetical protein